MKIQKIIFQGKSKKGTDIVIRCPEISDLKKLCRYVNALSKERTFVLFQNERISLKKEKEWLEKCLEGAKKKMGITLLVFAGKKVIGVCAIQARPQKIKKHIGGFGISVAKDYRGEGIGWLLMSAALGEAKKKLKGLKIVTLEVFEENAVARKMYKKMGFKKIGVLPKGLLYKGGYVNEVLMYKKIR